MSIRTEARGPAAGYLHQISYALLLLLSADADARLCIEKVDDLQISENGHSAEAQQLKHSIQTTPPNLTDRSLDLWKTLGNWCEMYQSGILASFNILSLVTVAQVGSASIPEQLKQPGHVRDNNAIEAALFNIASEPHPAQTLKPHLEKYRSLSLEQRRTLISRIRVVDLSPDILETPEKIKQKLQDPPHVVDDIYQRLMGWWTDRAGQHLLDHADSISKDELNAQLKFIREQLRDDNLPLDFADAEPPDEMFENQEQLRFVQQLTMIEMKQSTIESAIRDYFRAFSEKTQWVDDQRISLRELDRYERELVEHWQWYCERLKDEITDELPDSKIKFGRKIFYDLMNDGSVPQIRPLVTSGYVRRGFYQILAHGHDRVEPKVWWHPDFIKKLQEVLPLPQLEGHDLVVVNTPGPQADNNIGNELSPWNQRPAEIANLLNPAFGAVVLYDTIKAFTTANDQLAGMPYPLLYLIFPMVLDASVRDIFPARKTTKLHAWIQQHPEILPDFQISYPEFNQITNEAIRFGIRKQILQKVPGEASFDIIPQKRLKVKKHAGEFASEVATIRKLADRLGKIFASISDPVYDVVTIYRWFGVTP